jgi:hypothetical protein
MLEHRFYGESSPFLLLTPANLTYLSADQALADVAQFIEWIYSSNNYSVRPERALHCTS